MANNTLMQHTPEPWIVSGSIRIESEHEHGSVNDGWIIGDMCGSDAKANARRIVACVNSCAGIGNEDLESAKIANLLSAGALAIRQLQAITDKRDILLNALIGITDSYAAISIANNYDPNLNPAYVSVKDLIDAVKE